MTQGDVSFPPGSMFAGRLALYRGSLRLAGRVRGDIVVVNATLYLPRTQDGSVAKLPVVFTLTPYISDTYHARGAYFAAHGYVFALVDVRSNSSRTGIDHGQFAARDVDIGGHAVRLQHYRYIAFLAGGQSAGAVVRRRKARHRDIHRV